MEMAIYTGRADLDAQTAIQGDMMQSWIQYVDASEKTVATYTRSIRQYAEWLTEQGETRPNRDTIIRYRESLAAEHKPATVQAYMMAVKLFYRYTAQNGLYPDIADHVKSTIGRTADGHRKDYLTATQAARVLAQPDRTTTAGKRDYAMLSLMLTTGLRTIEVSRAQIADITTHAEETVLYIQGKGHADKDAYVKLSGPVLSAIRDYLSARPDADPEAPLFASASNRDRESALTTRSISRICKDTMQAAGYDSDRLTAHSLRHTAATLNLLAGGTLEETKQLLRHAQITTTMIYTHDIDRAKNQSESRISAAIFGA